MSLKKINVNKLYKKNFINEFAYLWINLTYENATLFFLFCAVQFIRVVLQEEYMLFWFAVTFPVHVTSHIL